MLTKFKNLAETAELAESTELTKFAELAQLAELAVRAELTQPTERACLTRHGGTGLGRARPVADWPTLKHCRSKVGTSWGTPAAKVCGMPATQGNRGRRD